ncbi:Ima1 N-terminal domain-containing protein [Helicostylum pulchrum]|nr:Ima1 N-terminal domain-containing protein [Helicostylum pulchrum]
MSSHVTHKKPSIVKIILNRLGIIDLHTRVNCWFCNQDAYLLPGSKNTADHWFCRLCENTNARDQNGDIIDPSPFQVENKNPEVYIQQERSSRPNTNKRALCRSCQEGQAIIYQTMSEHIPDESDPSYEERCATADKKHADLHQRHKLCTTCQKLIDQVVAEQKEALRFQNINRTVFNSLVDRNIDKRPSRRKYIIKGVMWTITHLATLIFIYYVMLHPPFRNDTYTMINWDYIVEKCLEVKELDFDDFRDLISLESVQGLIEFKLQGCKKFMTCLFTIDDLDCGWSINDHLICFILFNFASLISIDWNRAITPTIYEKVNNLGFYKKIQLVLFGLRFVLLAVIFAGLDKAIICFISIVYFSILFLSDRMMRTKDELKPVLNSFIMEESESEAEPMDISEPEISVPSSSIEPIDEISNIINRFHNL